MTSVRTFYELMEEEIVVGLGKQPASQVEPGH